MPTSVEAVLCASLFVVPGYVALEIAALLAPRRPYEETRSVLGYVAVSLSLNLLLSGYYANLSSGLIGDDFWAKCALPVLLSGFIAGIIIACARRANVFRRVAVRLGLNVNVEASPWDFKFSRLDDERWLKVALDDGRVIFGLYANASNASSTASDGRGIYIEMLTDENWVALPESDGMYIEQSSIKSVEFYKSKRRPAHEQRRQRRRRQGKGNGAAGLSADPQQPTPHPAKQATDTKS